MQIGSLNGHQSGIVYSADGIAPTLPAFTHGYALGGVLICSMRGRDKDNPKFRGKSNGNFAQTLEVREDQSVTNTITTVQKDNLLLEIQEEPELIVGTTHFPHGWLGLNADFSGVMPTIDASIHYWRTLLIEVKEC